MFKPNQQKHEEILAKPRFKPNPPALCLSTASNFIRKYEPFMVNLIVI